MYLIQAILWHHPYDNTDTAFYNNSKKEEQSPSMIPRLKANTFLLLEIFNSSQAFSLFLVAVTVHKHDVPK